MSMSWQMASLLLLGGSTVLLFVGMPVAISFIAINLIGATLFLGGDAGLHQVARNSVAAAINFSLTPIPLFILMGEVLFHTEGHRRRRAADPPGAGPPRSRCGHRRNDLLRDIGIDDSDDSDAWFVNAASNAIAWLQSRFSNRPDHGDWRSRYAHSAVRAHRLAR